MKIHMRKSSEPVQIAMFPTDIRLPRGAPRGTKSGPGMVPDRKMLCFPVVFCMNTIGWVLLGIENELKWGPTSPLWSRLSILGVIF